MKIALAMIVKGSQSEAGYLMRCLGFVAKHVDGIFITITGGDDPTPVRDVANLFNAHVSEFEWVKDFAAARNFNFSQVPRDYDYILWLDADDALRGGENLKRVIEENQDVDAFSLNYLYAFDDDKNPTVVHQKTQIVKNDGCVKWEGKLHEDFSPTREITTKLIKDIDRLHLSDDTRFEENKIRNLEIAQGQMDDNPDDPRSLWNLGNSLKALGKNKEAVELFDKFIEETRSEDEKYIVYLRKAESLWAMDEKDLAIEACRYAIGLRPEYPDAYILAGDLFHMLEKHSEAEKHLLMGLQKEPPMYTIMVWNPRDYDYHPMMQLARVYFAKGRPDASLTLLEACLKIVPSNESLKETIEKMRKEAALLDSALEYIKQIQEAKTKEEVIEIEKTIPRELRAQPSLCKAINSVIIKEESSGKDVVFFCGFTEKEWLPDTPVGGSEEAIIHISKRLVERGWNVTVYNNCGYKEHEYDGVKYKPFWMWNQRDKQDITVFWRSARMAEYKINSDKVFIDLHDTIPKGEFTEKRLENIDKVFVKSEFHRSLYPNVPDEKIVVVPNGIDSKEFAKSLKRDPMLLVNTSSPDRSLSATLDAFEIIKKEVPEAKLKWAYGWDIFDIVHGKDKNILAWKKEMKARIKELGVEELGRISHAEVMKLYKTANVFLYPTEFAEIDCISLSKAQAAGAIPVVTDFAALGEKQDIGGNFVHSTKTKDNWAAPYQFDFGAKKLAKKCGIIGAKELKKPRSEKERMKMRKAAQKRFDWEAIVDVWENKLNG